MAQPMAAPSAVQSSWLCQLTTNSELKAGPSCVPWNKYFLKSLDRQKESKSVKSRRRKKLACDPASELLVISFLPSNIVVSRGISQQFYYDFSSHCFSGIRTKFNTEANVGKPTGTDLAQSGYRQFSPSHIQRCFPKPKCFCCRLDPHLEFEQFISFEANEILRPDTFNQEMTRINPL